MPEQLTGLAKYLVDDGYLNTHTAEQALNSAQKLETSFTCYLTQNQIASSDDIYACLKHNIEISSFDANHDEIDKTLLSLIPTELLKRHRVLPLALDEHSLHLGMTDPTNHLAIAAISFHTGKRIFPKLISENMLDAFLKESVNSFSISEHFEQTLSQVDFTDEEAYDISSTEDDEPIAYAVNQLIQNAIQKQASDIHIEPFSSHYRIRFRCDGLLHEIANVPPPLALRMIARIKLLANLNITERRLPQDGRLNYQRDQTLDIRLNLFPTLHGEKTVMRLNHMTNTQLSLHSLGLLDSQQKLIENYLHRPQGLILVSGPTGCGKTATLYTFLQYLNSVENNIITAEDPIEIELPGINQLMINPKIGLSFNTTLRAMLRQDPDILMIGEIRDIDSATIALQAAQTGHLVLSSIHANHALDITHRLHTMGIDFERMGHTLSLAIAQRLIRKLCDHCKSHMKLTPHHPLAAKMTHAYVATGCKDCHQGYRERTGIFEVIPITDNLLSLIQHNTTPDQLQNYFYQHNIIRLWEAGIQTVQDGITSFEELLRVLGEAPIL